MLRIVPYDTSAKSWRVQHRYESLTFQMVVKSSFVTTTIGKVSGPFQPKLRPSKTPFIFEYAGIQGMSKSVQTPLLIKHE